MATLYFDMKQKQRITIDLNDSIFFEKFHERCARDVYSRNFLKERSIPLSSVMSFVSEINTHKELLLSFYGMESGGPHYIYNVHQKASVDTYKETNILIVFRETIYNSRMFFKYSSNNVSLSTLHKYTQYINYSFPEQFPKFKKSIQKLIKYITWHLENSLKDEFRSSPIVVDVVTAKKISPDTFMLTSKILFSQKDFVVFNLYLNMADKTKNKLVITKITEDT